MSSSLSKGFLIGGLFVFSLIVLFPSFFPTETPENYPFKKIKLGLDLRGGSYLIMGVKTEEAVTGHIASLATNLRAELREKRIGLLRARQIEGSGLELQLISSSAVEDVKAFMAENYPDMSLESEKAESPGSTQFLVVYRLTDKSQA